MNEKLKELLNISPDEATEKDNDELIEEIKTAQLIMPIEITSKMDINDAEVGDIIEIDDGLRFIPQKIIDDDNNLFIPLFSDDSEVYGHTSAIDIYTKDLAEMIDDNPENIAGVVLNPFSDFSVTLPMDSFLDLFKEED